VVPEESAGSGRRSARLMSSNPYDYQWRFHVCPPVLRDAGGQFEKRRYVGYAKCAKCKGIEPAVIKRRRWQVAHLDGDKWNRARWNLAVLCPACHKAQDLPLWSLRFRETMKHKAKVRNDAKRPILALLEPEQERMPW
jgi:5-methylcytosine-specific restriction endonuclease McrA